MSLTVASIIVSVFLGGMVVLIGVWGGRNAARLAPPTLPPGERDKRTRAMRRGAWACQVIGVLFAVAGVVSALW